MPTVGYGSLFKSSLALFPQEDLLIHGDSVYDIIDKQDHQSVQNELARAPTGVHDDARLFLCRMNVSRNARRQMRFGDQKVSHSLISVCVFHFLEHIVLGDLGGGALRVVPAAVHEERAGADSDVHPGGDAGDARVRRPGRHQHLHVRPQHGHEVRIHRRQVHSFYGKHLTAK